MTELVLNIVISNEVQKKIFEREKEREGGRGREREGEGRREEEREGEGDEEAFPAIHSFRHDVNVCLNLYLNCMRRR